MSNLTTENRQLANIEQVIIKAEVDFNRLAKIHNAVTFDRECSFALQAMKNSIYLSQIAAGDLDSLKTAILNVAAIGLTLSPVHKLAYLIPRKRKICLDLSYRGLIQLALDVGSINWALAEIVCEKDTFQLRGFGKEPIHKFSPFKERGNKVGAYCVGKTGAGDFITTWMTLADIYLIRERSEAWKAYKSDPKKSCPWVTDEDEMIKKTVIRRASKSWPMTDARRRLDQAIEVTSEPETVGAETIETNEIANELLPSIREKLIKINRTEAKFIDHLVRVFKRDIKKLEDLTQLEVNQAVVLLDGLIEKAEKSNEKQK